MKLKKPVVADVIPITSVLWKTVGYMAGEDCINLEKEKIYWETWHQQKACPCCRHITSMPYVSFLALTHPSVELHLLLHH